jgi:hypothetical protein
MAIAVPAMPKTHKLLIYKEMAVFIGKLGNTAKTAFLSPKDISFSFSKLCSPKKFIRFFIFDSLRSALSC